MAPLCVKGIAFPPVDGAPVLAAVEQTALGCGCGSALWAPADGQGSPWPPTASRSRTPS